MRSLRMIVATCALVTTLFAAAPPASASCTEVPGASDLGCLERLCLRFRPFNCVQ